MSDYVGKRRKMLGTAEIDQGLAEIAQIAQANNLPVLLVGGVAMHCYGSERLTSDLDIVSSAGLPPPLVAEGPLSLGGTRTHTPSGVPLDWINRNDVEDFIRLFDEALQYGTTVPGVPIRVVSAEYLSAMKLIAGRQKDDLDLTALLQLGVVDVPKATLLISRLLGAYAGKDFRSRAAQAAWLRTRDEEK